LLDDLNATHKHKIRSKKFKPSFQVKYNSNLLKMQWW